MLGTYDLGVLNGNGLLLLGFAEDIKLALLETLFCTPKCGVSYTFHSANRSKEQAHLDYILTKQVNLLISNIATNITDVMLSTAAKLVPRSKSSRGARLVYETWCGG